MAGNEWHVEYREAASYKAAVCTPYNTGAEKSSGGRFRYADDGFPLDVRTVIYKHLIDHTVNCHWHYDFEMGLILDGSIDCIINDTQLKLVKGDVFFINSNVLHMSTQADSGKDAVTFTLTFPASLLTTHKGSSIYTKYFAPLITKKIEGFAVSGDTPEGHVLRELLTGLYKLEPSSFGYELECLAYFNRLWLAALLYMQQNDSHLLYRVHNMRHSERMKGILSYIHTHYHEKMTVGDIAKHVSISRGECFRCFRHYMGKTIVAYTNAYRLQRAAALLRETEKRLIDISTECGFESTSYFSRHFKSAYAMSPLQYRKATIWTENTQLHTNGYDYEYWKNQGNGNMTITAGANNGSFSCDWHSIEDMLFRSGKKFIRYGKTHSQMGHISLRFDAAYTSEGCSYLCVYGWTVDPMVEWYIVECYTARKPPLGLSCLGTHEADGGQYELFSRTRHNQPSILGTGDFEQYWSVRTTTRLSGVVDVSSHLRAWESLGLALGAVTEVALSIEGWRSSGSANVHTNVLTVTPEGHGCETNK